MGKPKRKGIGFSDAKPAAAPKQQDTKSSADQAAKEQQAVALINQGKLQEAEAIYKDLISAGTRNHIVFGNLAAICGMQGRFDELIELLNKAIQLKPNYPDAHYNLGNALQEQGDLHAAIASFNTALQQTLDALDLQVDPTLIQRLKEVNADLWQIEDALRDQEHQKSFGETFIRLARSVYQQNDRRAAIKKEINITYGSALVEEKAYQGY